MSQLFGEGSPQELCCPANKMLVEYLNNRRAEFDTMQQYVKVSICLSYGHTAGRFSCHQVVLSVSSTYVNNWAPGMLMGCWEQLSPMKWSAGCCSPHHRGVMILGEKRSVTAKHGVFQRTGTNYFVPLCSELADHLFAGSSIISRKSNPSDGLKFWLSISNQRSFLNGSMCVFKYPLWFWVLSIMPNGVGSVRPIEPVCLHFCKGNSGPAGGMVLRWA